MVCFLTSVFIVNFDVWGRWTSGHFIVYTQRSRAQGSTRIDEQWEDICSDSSVQILLLVSVTPATLNLCISLNHQTISIELLPKPSRIAHSLPITVSHNGAKLRCVNMMNSELVRAQDYGDCQQWLFVFVLVQLYTWSVALIVLMPVNELLDNPTSPHSTLPQR